MDLPQFSFERCGNCPGLTCEAVITMRGAHKTLRSIDTALAVFSDELPVDEAMEQARLFEEQAHFDREMAVLIMNSLGCEFDRERILKNAQDAEEFFWLNNPERGSE